MPIRIQVALTLLVIVVAVACNGPVSTLTPSPSASPTTASQHNKIAARTEIRQKDGATVIFVPVGEFPMGSSDVEIDIAKTDCQQCPADWFDDEQPQHPVYLDAYWIDKYEVTNQQFAKFIEEGGYDQRDLWTEEGWQWKNITERAQPKFWDDDRWNQTDYPVVGVVWFEAVAYCHWAGARLPTEAEWERAAGWDAGKQEKYIYPWGNEWDSARVNTVESTLGATTPVGQYCLQGASPVGACDMVGNAWEWMSSIYLPYPYDANDGREEIEIHGTRALRGGSWINERDRARVAYRLPPFPGDFILFDPTNGFRCAMTDQ